MNHPLVSGNNLNAKNRSLLFRQLAQTERAGLTAIDAVQMLLQSAGGTFQDHLRDFRERLKTGEAVASSGRDCGLFLAWECRLISAAETSGKLPRVYASLAQRYSDRAQRNGRLKSGLMLPLVIFILATFIAPVSQLATGAIGLAYYLWVTCGRIALLLGAIWLLLQSWQRLDSSGADNSIYRLLLNLPYFGELIRQQQQYDYLFSLALLLEAGVPAIEALEIAAGSISHPVLREHYAGASSQVAQSRSVAQALDACGATPNPDASGMINSAEFSGRLDEMLFHVAAQLREELEQRYATLADWTPRIIYLLLIVTFVLSL